ncbi:NAD(P)-dependent dehydrogenase (short-subunit alcohol dehydrogenase family) [Actinoplanes lutulentus]|uniref:Short subunit dehydrogenase n=1 Tax=Actinoplanes lutulentus TaxID=1287878 RepID=A0A327YYL1_9ACTN|nr:SDR family NAD(P)-dependent oxidoreductase [Actinoplanes lutulentus]MBB2943503.1 NAD(P)-dependent dehydrogenase (short-subunit alcohol dehydrogenase family) [Actinoplanes lutulentus]RAK25978.1 short subunit dehydrogenase [Actinoplanes lutulentus]
MSVWFVTGASRGLGLDIVNAALERGDKVVATARDPRALEETEDLLVLPLDVTDETQAEKAVAAAVERFGGIDILVNNAGRGLVGAVEETSDAEARAVFDINVFGLLTVVRAVVPVMRAAGHGRILNISSTGGVVAWAGWGVYSATKFAVEGLTEAMRLELAPLGIQVTSVQPGPLRTDFLGSSSLAHAERIIDAYAETGGASRAWAADNHQLQEGDPVKAAAAILTVADLAEMPARIPLGTSTLSDIRTKLAAVGAELDQWQDLTRSTDV